MNRRTMLLATLLAPYAFSKPPEIVDALLCGDSISGQLGARLAKEATARGKRFLYNFRAGSSTRQWSRGKWLERIVKQHPTRLVLVSLGVNCTRAERPSLRKDMRAVIAQAGETPVLWLVPNKKGYRFDLSYLHNAVAKAGVEVFEAPVLPLESDRVHFTDAGNRELAKLVADRLWGQTR